MESIITNNSFLPLDEYEVEEILDYRKIIKINIETKEKSVVKEYLIKWLGYNEETWEPESHLEHCQKLLRKFKKKIRQQKSKKQKKEKKRKIIQNNISHSKYELEKENIYQTPKKNTLSSDNQINCFNTPAFNYLYHEEENNSLNKNNGLIKKSNDDAKFSPLKEEEFLNSKENIDYIYKINYKIENREDKEKTNNVLGIQSQSSISTDFIVLIDLGKKEIKPFSIIPYSSSSKKDKDLEKEKDINNEQDNNSDSLKDINENQKIEFCSITQIKVPKNSDECINIEGKFKVDDKFIFSSGKNDLSKFPTKEIMKCYEILSKGD